MPTLYPTRKLTIPFTMNYLIGWLSFMFGTYQSFFKSQPAVNPFTAFGVMLLVHYTLQFKDENPQLIAWGLWFSGLIVQLAQIVAGYQMELTLPLGLMLTLTLATQIKERDSMGMFILMSLLIVLPFEWQSVLVISALTMIGMHRKDSTRYYMFFFAGLMTIVAFSQTAGLSLMVLLGSAILANWREEKTYEMPFLSFIAFQVMAHIYYFFFAYILLSLM